MISDPDYLKPRPAHQVPLSPISFLYRTADVYPDHLAVIDGDRRFTWTEVRSRCVARARGIRTLGMTMDDVVSVLPPNTVEMVEVHFGT